MNNRPLTEDYPQDLTLLVLSYLTIHQLENLSREKELKKWVLLQISRSYMVLQGELEVFLTLLPHRNYTRLKKPRSPKEFYLHIVNQIHDNIKEWLCNINFIKFEWDRDSNSVYRLLYHYQQCTHNQSFLIISTYLPYFSNNKYEKIIFFTLEHMHCKKLSFFTSSVQRKQFISPLYLAINHHASEALIIKLIESGAENKGPEVIEHDPTGIPVKSTITPLFLFSYLNNLSALALLVRYFPHQVDNEIKLAQLKKDFDINKFRDDLLALHLQQVTSVEECNVIHKQYFRHFSFFSRPLFIENLKIKMQSLVKNDNDLKIIKKSPVFSRR